MYAQRPARTVVPLLPNFDFALSDLRFLGDPVDYIVFDGYTNVRDNDGSAAMLELVLLEIKTGSSASLSAEQLAIKQAIQFGRVRFDELRISDDGEIIQIETSRPVIDFLCDGAAGTPGRPNDR